MTSKRNQRRGQRRDDPPDQQRLGGPHWGGARLAAGMGALLALTLAVYVPAMRAGFVWDDDAYVTENPTLRTISGLKQIWLEPGATPQYYPLVFSTFWLEYKLWELQPAGYHIVNILLHATVAMLLFVALRRLSVPGAWLAAAVFALHPVHVESVAWVTERKNVLSGVFYLAALLACINPLGVAGDGNQSTGGVRPWIAPFVFFLLALLSKTSTVTFPAALLLIIWWKHGSISRRDVLRVVPFFVLAAAMSAVTVWVEWFNLGGTGEGALGDEWSLSLLERLLVASRAICFYVEKLLWPCDLSFIYTQWTPDSRMWSHYLYPVAAMGAIAAFFLARRRIGRGPLASFLFFAGTLTPVLGFFNIFFFRYSLVADHFQYLPSIGILVLLVGSAATMLNRPRASVRLLGLPAAALLLAALGAVSWQRQQAFTDVETLWRDTLSKNRACWLAHINLANLLRVQGKLIEAEDHYTDAVYYNPNSPEAHSNLGAMLAQRGEQEQALLHLRKAVALRPDLVSVRLNIGTLLGSMGEYAEALPHFLEIVHLMPRNVRARLTLGNLFEKLGKRNEAIRHYREALRISPDDPMAKQLLQAALTAPARKGPK